MAQFMLAPPPSGALADFDRGTYEFTRYGRLEKEEKATIWILRALKL